jgi:hypothetical protein
MSVSSQDGLARAKLLSSASKSAPAAAAGEGGRWAMPMQTSWARGGMRAGDKSMTLRSTTRHCLCRGVLQLQSAASWASREEGG